MSVTNEDARPIELSDVDSLGSWIGQLVGEPINDVRVEPLTSFDSASGVPLYRVAATSPREQYAFVMKIASPNSDWIARATRDVTVREAALINAGLPEMLPPEIRWPALATRPSANRGWIMLMQDVAAIPGAQLVPQGDEPLTSEETARHLRNMATLHRSFFGRQTDVVDVELCDLRDWILLLGPDTIARERGGNDPVTPHLKRGWELFQAVAPEKVGKTIDHLLRDPTILVTALTRGQMTLLHGDFKFGNLGVLASPAGPTIALDWSQAMWGPPELDLAWFLAVNSARLPFRKQDAIEIYREALGVEDDSDWQFRLDIALLAGGVLRLGWAKALGAASDDPRIAEREANELNHWLRISASALRRLNLI